MLSTLFETSIFGKIKLFLTITSILIIISIIGYFSYQYYDLKQSKKQLQLSVEEIQKKNSELLIVNGQNDKTIKSLQEDILKRDKLISDYNSQKTRDNKKLDEFAKIISSYSPNDDGKIAKVLRDTMIKIQEDREGRIK